MIDTYVPSQITLKIPCKAEFVSIVRLMILGIASHLQFTYDEVEDIRLAVGEACASAIDRAEKSISTNPEISIIADIDENKLIIAIEDQFIESESFENPNITDDDIDKNGISSLLIQLLVDNYSSEKVNDKTIVTITKYMGCK